MVMMSRFLDIMPRIIQLLFPPRMMKMMKMMKVIVIIIITYPPSIILPLPIPNIINEQIHIDPSQTQLVRRPRPVMFR
jgi:hypothetical protein